MEGDASFNVISDALNDMEGNASSDVRSDASIRSDPLIVTQIKQRLMASKGVPSPSIFVECLEAAVKPSGSGTIIVSLKTQTVQAAKMVKGGEKC